MVWRGGGRLTLLYSSRSEAQNHAVVLRDRLDGMRKTPAGSAQIRHTRVRPKPQRT
jgi:hypothetical protein